MQAVSGTVNYQRFVSGQKEAQYSPVMPVRNIERLPWTPKVRQKDIDQFLDATRNKFIGFTLPEDNQSLAGLPQPIHEGFKTLKQVILFNLSICSILKIRFVDSISMSV